VISSSLGKIRIEVKNNRSFPDFKENDTILFYWDYNDGILLEY